MRRLAIALAAAAGVLSGAPIGAGAQQPQLPVIAIAPVTAIDPPPSPLPREQSSARVTRFSFIAYGDTRGDGDGQVVHPEHSRLVNGMIRRIKSAAGTAFPIRFALQSGDAVARGQRAEQWNVSFVPIVSRLTREGGVPYFFAVGNHDVTGIPGDPGRAIGLHNTLSALARLIPPEGSARRLNGYPTYAFGYGNLFAIAIDSNIASDPVQLAWVASQLEHLDRVRYPLVIAFFHHPPFSSGPHGGPTLEPQAAAIRESYMPLFRRHHVRLIIAGHEHLFEHWVERFMSGGTTYRLDEIVTGGGGAPIYTYKGEPDLRAYFDAGAADQVQVEHVARPGATPADNPHHFVIVRVDGSRLSLDVVSIDGAELKPYAGRSHADLGGRAN